MPTDSVPAIELVKNLLQQIHDQLSQMSDAENIRLDDDQWASCVQVLKIIELAQSEMRRV